MINGKGKIVSVVLAAYNGERYIKDQLDSIICQSYPPDEIIIVDDCSSDGTWEILCDSAKLHACVRIFRNEDNLGVSGAFTRAIEESTGDFIFISDQDDVWMKDKLRVFLDAWDGEMLLYSDAIVVDSELKVLCDSEFEFHRCGNPSPLSALYFLNNNCVSGHNAMITRDLLTSLFPVPPGVVYDQWFALVAACIGKVGYLDNKVCMHRMHSSNAVNNPELRRAQRKKKGVSHVEKVKAKRNQYLSYLNAVSLVVRDGDSLSRVVKMLVDQYSGASSRIFNIKLFIHLMSYRREMYPSVTGWRRVRKIRNHCFGDKMLFLLR